MELLNKALMVGEFILTKTNPVAGVAVGAIRRLAETKKEASKMLEGKKTYIGIAVTALAFIAQFMGYDMPLEAKDGLETSFMQIAEGVGILIATYGRIKTKKS